MKKPNLPAFQPRDSVKFIMPQSVSMRTSNTQIRQPSQEQEQLQERVQQEQRLEPEQEPVREQLPLLEQHRRHHRQEQRHRHRKPGLQHMPERHCSRWGRVHRRCRRGQEHSSRGQQDHSIALHDGEHSSCQQLVHSNGSYEPCTWGLCSRWFRSRYRPLDLHKHPSNRRSPS